MTEEIIEFNSEDDEAAPEVRLSDFSQAVLWGTDWTVETVLAQLERGNIELNPRFQRRDAWTRLTKSRFIESIILGLPVPQVVLAEQPGQRGRYIILDGKQRLLALLQFRGLANGASNSFSLSGLDVRKDLLRKRYTSFVSDSSLRPDLDAFLTHTIRTVVIRNWPSISFLHIVFQRLNTGSLKLSAQELRQAVVPGPFTDFADDFTVASPEIPRLLGRTGPDPRMRDVELLVRSLSFRLRLEAYSGRMKEFLDESCITLNRSWDSERESVEVAAGEFQSGVRCLEEIFGENNVARKLYSRLFNRSIFDALIYYAYDPELRSRMIHRKNAVLAAYEETIRDEKFQEAVESDTAGVPHTADRLRIWGEALSSAIEQPTHVPRIQPNSEGQDRFVR